MSESAAESLRKEIVSGLKNVNKLQRLVALATVDASAPADSEAVRLAGVVRALCAVFAHFDAQGILAQGESAAAPPAAKRARSTAESAGGATAKVGAWVLARWDDALAAVLRAAADAALAPALRDAAVDGWIALVARASPAQAATHVARAVDAFAAAVARPKSENANADTTTEEKEQKEKEQQKHKWEKVATRRVVERFASTHLAGHADLYGAWLQALLRRVGAARGLAGPLTLLALTPLPTEAEAGAPLWRTAGAAGRGGDVAELYGACWTAVLRHELPDALLRKVLRVLPDAVLPFVPQPLTLLDMLTAAYARGGILSVLSLKGIYYMMTHNNLFVIAWEMKEMLPSLSLSSLSSLFPPFHFFTLLLMHGHLSWMLFFSLKTFQHQHQPTRTSTHTTETSLTFTSSFTRWWTLRCWRPSTGTSCLRCWTSFCSRRSSRRARWRRS